MYRAIFIAIAALSPALAIADGGWRLAGQSDKQQWVLIDKKLEKNTDIYRAAIDKLCAGKSFCSVLFWSDPKSIPTSLPMSDAQTAAMRASWTYNASTGQTKLLWSCEIVNDSSQCFR
jgi:hypothetical protein